MLFGTKQEFAIECYHEPLGSNAHTWVFGRMCVWCHDQEIGDLFEPACMLNVTEGFFEDCLARIPLLDNPSLNKLSDEVAFEKINDAIYKDDDRSNKQVYEDALEFSKHIFLTGWGESFDVNRGVLLRDGEIVRIVWRQRSRPICGHTLKCESFVNTIQAFLDWMNDEKSKVLLP